MKRRIALIIFVSTLSVITISFALWYSGVSEESDCVRSGGTWVAVRKTCFRE